MMQKLSALILSAAIVPALALSTAAFAQERDEMQGGEQGAAEQRADEQGAGEQAAGEQRADEQGAGEQAAGEQRADEQGAGEQAAGKQRADEQMAGEQAAGAQYLSSKPAGALYADDLIGKTVKHRGSDEDVGEIQDLVIGEDGRIIGVVVTTSGFLGLGGQEVGLGWDHIEHTMENEESVFYTDMDEESLQNAPEYVRE